MVRVKPHARRDEILGIRAGILEVRIAARPAAGAANARLLGVLADYYGVGVSSVRLLSGRTGRLKRVAVRRSTGA